VTLIAGGDELRGDAHAFARTEHCALHDVIHPELPGNFGQRLLDAFVLKD
jgi:hypothetical protein